MNTIDRPSQRDSQDSRSSLPGVGDVHSFVLRVRLEPSLSGFEKDRRHFELEEVGGGRCWRRTDFDRLVELLSERIAAALDRSDPR